MALPSPKPHRRSAYWLPGLGLAVLGVVVSGWLAWQQAASIQTSARSRFIQEARAFSDVLAQRIAINTEIVHGLRGLFSSQPRLSRADFQRVASELDVAKRLPGIRNLSFTRLVRADQKAAFEASVRADTSLNPGGYPDFAIHPTGEREEYFVADYLWPLEGNPGVMGLDISAQPSNLSAMRYSRDSGLAVASAPFDLVQESEHRAGFVIRVPVFDRSGLTDPQAPAPFIGAVATTLRVYDLVQSLARDDFLTGMAVSIDDIGSTREPDAPAAAMALLPQTRAVPPEFAQAQPYERELRVHDRRWRLVFQPTQSFLSASEQRLPWVVGAAGSLVSLLLGALVGLLARQNTRALARAQISDDARRQSDGRFQALFNQGVVGVAQINTETHQFVRLNQRYCDILGYTLGEIAALDLRAMTHPGDLAQEQAQLAELHRGERSEFRMEKRHIHKNGEEIWVDLTVTPMWLPGATPDFHMAVVQDITSRKAMEASLRGNELRLRSILRRLPLGLCLVQGDGRMTFRNERFVEICGYTEEDIPTAEQWWKQVYPDPDYRDLSRSAWAQARQIATVGDGTMPPGEYLIQCRDGQRRAVEIAGVLMGDDHLITMVDLSQRKSAEEEIRYLAFYDPLTRLPNRRLLMDRLQQALATSARHQRCGALMLLDLDNFKTLNETRGHDRGDTLLLQVAHRLRDCLHEDDTVARQGGDEFVVVLEDLGDNPEEAAARSEEVGQRILTVLREPYTLDGAPHHSSLSMGITIFSDMRESVDELLKRADLAMYQAKSAGRDTLRFYDPQMQAVVSERAAMELDMRAGLAQGQFELYYQPQMDNGRITGAEALLRWRHPRDGFVSPAHFIPLAEESGLILPLGQWVLTAACNRLAAWAQQPDLAELTLAVNVSPRQFHQSGFVPQVLAALAGSGAQGRKLKLELTEGLLLTDVEDTIAKMGQLKAYSVGFSLDDFGTGYSSLSYLKRLPLDQLKIDQSFVHDVLTDPNDAAIARTVVALAKSLGLSVIAEGVETEAQREFLARSDCHAWQGYLLSPPVPVAQLERLVRDHNQR